MNRTPHRRVSAHYLVATHAATNYIKLVRLTRMLSEDYYASVMKEVIKDMDKRIPYLRYYISHDGHSAHTAAAARIRKFGRARLIGWPRKAQDFHCIGKTRIFLMMN